MKLSKHELELLFKELEECNFQCIAGPLENSIAYRKLKKEIIGEKVSGSNE